MKLSRIFLCFMGFTVLFLAACGDDEQTSNESRPGYNYYGVECPRLELESFDDCFYESIDPTRSHIDLNDKTEIANFCLSTCDKVKYVSAYNRGNSAVDLSLLVGISYVTSIELNGMQNIQSLDGLKDLEEVEREFFLLNNPQLTEVKALSSLKKVGDALVIQNNKKLETLQGLESFRMAHSLLITVNDELRDITALNHVESLKYFHVEDSPDLPTCQAEYIRDKLGLNAENVSIRGNGVGLCD